MALGFGLLGLALQGAAHAHPMPASLVHVEVISESAQPALVLEAQIPLHRLEWVLGRPLVDPAVVHPADRLKAAQGLLSAYMLQHVGARSDGVGWTVLAPTLTAVGQGDATELHARMLLLPPAGVLPPRVTLMYDVVTHSLHTHQVLLHLKRDPARPLTGPAPLITGLREDRRSVELALQPTPGSALFLDGIRLGVQHLAEGGDHVLFVMLLLLPAPLLVRSRRWVPGRSAGQTLRHLLGLATGFTLGHSLTLAWGALGGLQLPAAVVEPAIAMTLLWSALHAARPLVAPATMAVVACAFGCVHGLAFSQTLLSLGLSGWPLLTALLGFNLGIELAQLAALALPLPGLLLLAPTRYQAPVRVVAASLCALAAAAWLLQRLGSTPFGDLQALGGIAPFAPLCLAVVAIGLWLRSRGRPPSQAAGIRAADHPP